MHESKNLNSLLGLYNFDMYLCMYDFKNFL